MIRRPLRSASTSIAGALLVAACGGGGGSPSAPAPAPAPAAVPITLSGTAADGAPLAYAVVTLRDASGVERKTTADGGGRFTFFDLKADSRVMQPWASARLGQRQVVHYALVPGLTASATVNVTPPTTAIAALSIGSYVALDLEAVGLGWLSPDHVKSGAAQLAAAL